MSQFSVFAQDGSPISGAKVVIRRASDNVVLFSGVTDAAGVASSISIPDNTPCTVLVYGAGSARVAIQAKSGVLTPSYVDLIPLASRTVTFNVNANIPGSPLSGVSVKVFDGTHTQVASNSTDAGGNCNFVLPGDLTGYIAEFRKSGFNGVGIPLIGLDQVASYAVILDPVIASDE